MGLKKAVHYSCLTGCCGFLLMASAPFFGKYACYAAITGALIYCLQRALYGASWYPLLDVFLRPEDRGKFFGFLRFLYYTFTGILFYLVGLAMGKNPPVWLMQGVIAAAGILILGRDYCISRFPDDLQARRELPNIRKALMISVSNGPLTAYSVYVCLLTIAQTSLGPLTYIYLSKYVGMEPGKVQILSAVAMIGHILGFLFYSPLLHRFGVKKLEFAVHVSYIVAAMSMFALNCRMPGFTVVAAAILCLITFTGSIFGCNNSGEMLALARPGNKTMATAFVQTYTSIGGFVGRGGVSLMLGVSMLAPEWMLGNMVISRYQTIFLLCGCIATVILILFPTLPAVVPKHHDYYVPER